MGEVANIWATMGLHDNGLRSGLSSARQSIGQTVQSMTGLNVASIGVGAGIAALGNYMRRSVSETMNYGMQIRDLSHNFNMTTEQASLLVQSLDDVGIDAGNLNTAFRTMINHGINPTLESFQRLAEQYVNLSDENQRATFLMQNFGRAGLELGRYMELGAAGIQELADAQADNLILTDDQVEAANDLRTAQDGLNDALQGVSYTLGNALIPLVTDAANGFLTLINWTDNLRRTFEEHEQQVRDTSESYDDYLAETMRAAIASGQFGRQIRSMWEYVQSGGELSTAQLEIFNQALADAGILLEENFGQETVEAVSGVSDTFAGLGLNLAVLAEQAMTTTNNMLNLRSLLQGMRDEGFVITVDIIERMHQINTSAPDQSTGASNAGKYGARSGMFRAGGGNVYAGSPYIVGERGPEWFVPSQSGNIVSNNTPITAEISDASMNRLIDALVMNQ